MPIIVLASKNPVKMRAVKAGFSRMFPDWEYEIQTISVDSGVSDQPNSNEETLKGACNRAESAMSAMPAADYWVGVEGGVEDLGDDMTAFAWIVVRSNQVLGKGRTGAFFLPEAVSRLVRQGVELGEADDLVFGRSNSKQENGAIGLLTGNVVDRAQLYEQAVVLALVPFKNPDLYSGKTE